MKGTVQRKRKLKRNKRKRKRNSAEILKVKRRERWQCKINKGGGIIRENYRINGKNKEKMEERKTHKREMSDERSRE
jgi:hypothetical protein